MTTIAGIFSGVRFGVQSICLSDIAYAWCDQRVHVFGGSRRKRGVCVLCVPNSDRDAHDELNMMLARRILFENVLKTLNGVHDETGLKHFTTLDDVVKLVTNATWHRWFLW